MIIILLVDVILLIWASKRTSYIIEVLLSIVPYVVIEHVTECHD